MIGPNPYPTIGAYGADNYNDFELFFDYSAIASSLPPTPGTAQFLGEAALNNRLSSGGAANQAFGDPHFRYGFDQGLGQSREYSNLTDRHFLGRYTLAETSTLAFNWPQRPSSSELRSNRLWLDADEAMYQSGNPLDVSGFPVNLLSTGLVQEFNGIDESDSAETETEGRGGRRQLEDLLLANVHEMRIEIWDERADRFVVPATARCQIRTIEWATTTFDEICSSMRVTDGFHMVPWPHTSRQLQPDSPIGSHIYSILGTRE